MIKSQSKIILALLSFCICQFPVKASNEKNTTAKVTEAHGDVFKRGFVDWEKEIWQDPQPAKRGDLMQEGMQLGTGDKSWAQLNWSYITARAWANSVYAIAPNQRLVYLMGGEMLYHLDKHRKDKDDYFVWTKLIQARIRGTTVLFQCTGDTTRVTVLEGCIDVMNRKDKSIVRIEPGVVYEVKEVEKGESVRSDLALNAATNATANASAAANQGSKSVGSMNTRITIATQIPTTPIDSLHGITVPNVLPVKIFQTQQTITSLYLANPQSLLTHPLLTALELPLSSLSLVTHTLTALIPAVGNLLNGVEGLLDKTLLSESKIIAVPKTVSYRVGPSVGNAFILPSQSTAFFPPSGIIGKPGPFGQAPLSANMNTQVSSWGANGVNRLGAIGPSIGSIGSVTNIPTVTTVMPGAIGATGSAGIAGLTGAAGMNGMSGVAGLTTGFSQIPGAFGARSGAVAGAVGAVGALAGGVAGSPAGLGRQTGGAVSGLSGQVNNLLQNTGNTLGHLLGGSGSGGLGIHLGH